MAGNLATADVREISWADLLPVLDPLQNPLQGVDQAVREDLARLARIKIDIAQGFLNEDSVQVAEANARVTARLKEGINLRSLEQAVATYEAELERREGLLNTTLEGNLIKMPGYAVPLESTADGTTEFFLVPFFGACIHVPPPPPNQIVSVSTEDPVKLGELFEPVWVTGRMNTEESSQSLTLVDGTADIPYGYRLTDVKIEPYQLK